MWSATDIVRAFDALHQKLELFVCNDGSIGAHMPTVQIRDGSTMIGLTGYGEDPNDAVYALWRQVEEMESDQYLSVNRRYYQWNGVAWKEYELAQA